MHPAQHLVYPSQGKKCLADNCGHTAPSSQYLQGPAAVQLERLIDALVQPGHALLCSEERVQKMGKAIAQDLQLWTAGVCIVRV